MPLSLAHVAVQHLTQLSLANNNIASLEGLETLTNLTVLDLRNNAVSEMEHVAPLSHIPWLRELSLEGVPRRAAFPRDTFLQYSVYLNSTASFPLPNTHPFTP